MDHESSLHLRPRIFHDDENEAPSGEYWGSCEQVEELCKLLNKNLTVLINEYTFNRRRNSKSLLMSQVLTTGNVIQPNPSFEFFLVSDTAAAIGKKLVIERPALAFAAIDLHAARNGFTFARRRADFVRVAPLFPPLSDSPEIADRLFEALYHRPENQKALETLKDDNKSKNAANTLPASYKGLAPVKTQRTRSASTPSKRIIAGGATKGIAYNNGSETDSANAGASLTNGANANEESSAQVPKDGSADLLSFPVFESYIKAIKDIGDKLNDGWYKWDRVCQLCGFDQQEITCCSSAMVGDLSKWPPVLGSLYLTSYHLVFLDSLLETVKVIPLKAVLKVTPKDKGMQHLPQVVANSSLLSAPFSIFNSVAKRMQIGSELEVTWKGGSAAFQFMEVRNEQVGIWISLITEMSLANKIGSNMASVCAAVDFATSNIMRLRALETLGVNPTVTTANGRGAGFLIFTDLCDGQLIDDETTIGNLLSAYGLHESSAASAEAADVAGGTSGAGDFTQRASESGRWSPVAITPLLEGKVPPTMNDRYFRTIDDVNFANTGQSVDGTGVDAELSRGAKGRIGTIWGTVRGGRGSGAGNAAEEHAANPSSPSAATLYQNIRMMKRIILRESRFGLLRRWNVRRHTKKLDVKEPFDMTKFIGRAEAIGVLSSPLIILAEPLKDLLLWKDRRQSLAVFIACWAIFFFDAVLVLIPLSVVGVILSLFLPPPVDEQKVRELRQFIGESFGTRKPEHKKSGSLLTSWLQQTRGSIQGLDFMYQLTGEFEIAVKRIHILHSWRYPELTKIYINILFLLFIYIALLPLRYHFIIIVSTAFAFPLWRHLKWTPLQEFIEKIPIDDIDIAALYEEGKDSGTNKRKSASAIGDGDISSATTGASSSISLSSVAESADGQGDASKNGGIVSTRGDEEGKVLDRVFSGEFLIGESDDEDNHRDIRQRKGRAIDLTEVAPEPDPVGATGEEKTY